MIYPKLIAANIASDFLLQLHYDNGETRYYNFTNNFSHPAFASLNNPEQFANFHIHNGCIEWENGMDFCPFTLYEQSIAIP